jgi:hypothetical protein
MTLEKTVLTASILAVLACYSLSTVLTSLHSSPTTAKAAVVGGQASPAKGAR